MEDRYTLRVNFGVRVGNLGIHQPRCIDIVTICFQKWYRNDLFWYLFIDVPWFFACFLMLHLQFLRFLDPSRWHGICKAASAKFCVFLFWRTPIRHLVFTVHLTTGLLGKPILRLDENPGIRKSSQDLMDLFVIFKSSWRRVKQPATRWSLTVRVTNSVFLLDRCVCLFVVCWLGFAFILISGLQNW